MASLSNNPVPLVTVAVAVYNNADYLEEFLDCIEKQTYTTLEILCIDDGSTDNSVEILRHRANNDTRYRIIVKDHNVGVSDTRNLSLSMARGEYIYFCDADDLCNPDMLKKAVTLAEKECADLVIWDFYEFGLRLYPLVKIDSPSSLTSSFHRLIHTGAFMWTHLFRTSSLRALNLPFPIGRTKQDLPVHFAACVTFERICTIPERLYGYRISMSQTSRKKGRVLLDFIYVHDYLKDFLLREDKFCEYKNYFYQSLASSMYSVCFTIAPQHMKEAKELCRKHMCPELLAANSKASFRLRLFLANLQGSVFAGLALKTVHAAEKVYHKFFTK